MSTVRVYKVAELLDITSNDVLALLKKNHGIELKSASSTLEEIVARQFVERLAKQKGITLPKGDMFSEQAGKQVKTAAKAKADGLFRVWSTIMSDPAAFPMFKGGYPLTAAGKAGLAKWNPRNNILLKCGTKGTPLIMISPLPMDFRRDGDTIIMRLEEYDSVRTIHMNPKAVAPAAHTLFGFSRGRWDGTTLVVETDHIAAGYFDHEGTPQSDQIKTVERFIPNAEYTRLDYILTTTDPVNFTKPFDLKRYFVWKPENRVYPYECLDRFEPGK